MAKGLDIGTMNIVMAKKEGSKTVTSRIRDAFLSLPKSSKKLLKLSGADFVETDDEILILSDAALEMANMFGREVRRPLSKGLVSPNEIGAVDVLAYMIKSILGDPQPNEPCYFSIPSAPIDNPSRDTIYHKRLFERIVSDIGYKAIPSNEAMAIIFSECSRENFTGIAFSFGSGMTNIALANLSIECMAFSVERGGDWIDQGASMATGQSQASVCLTKEQGIDLLAPQNRIEEALSFYYKELIEYSLSMVTKQFQKNKLQMVFSKPIPIVVSGGTSKAGNFLEFFKNVVSSKRLPFEISEIRQARDPYNAVAYGLLVQAMQED
tara:strand:- start:450 stop:1421 length:972 start_codon:yes stop_codon:yes gene_type:complete